MRNDICTIPVNKIFEVNDGCPICRMRDTVEERILDYIMGAAMMEPDVRIETNRLGFCGEHLHMMVKRRGRLSFALTLETHLDEVYGKVFKGLMPNAKGQAAKAAQVGSTCFVCEKIEWGFSRMLETLVRSYETDCDFRTLFDGQPMLCLPHYQRLMQTAAQYKMKRYGEEFVSSAGHIAGDYLKLLSREVKHFCSMYDYRNAGENADWGNSKDSVERAVGFLSSRTPR